jgi:hypothetical protein
MNEPFNLEFSRLLLGEYAAKHGWADPVIKSVETQVSHSSTNCCPDMRFTLDDGHIILCENKIEAPETQGSSSDPRGQLRRYLDLPCDGLVYIRATPNCSLDPEVAAHHRFVTRNGHHFLWRDIYPILASSSDFLVTAVCKGFETMGFVPPHPAVGTLSNFNAAVDEKNRSAFQELWQPAADYGRQRGWKAETTKNAELYYSPDTTSPLYQIFVSPSKAERFLIRMTLRNGADPAKLCENLGAVVNNVPFEMICYVRMSPRNGLKMAEEVIDITASLSNVIGVTENREEISQRLLGYVKGFVGCI